MTTKTAKATKTTSKKTATLHLATAGKGTPICGGKGRTGTPETANCEACKKIAAHAEEKAKNDSKAGKASLPLIGEAPAPAKPEAKAEKPESKKAKPAAEPRERDPRLPAPGTVLKKLDRHGAVRCECKVTDAGIVYKSETFRSLSAAAMAAAKDLGINGSQNGFLFWGLIKQQPRITDPVEALEAAWKRYHERVKTITGSELEKPALVKVFNALEYQAREIAEISKSL